MDFGLTDEQQALRDLTAQIADDACTIEHLRTIADSDTGTDLDLWRTLAEAGLVGIGLPEGVGGGGLGWLETCVVLSELARASAPVPALATAMVGPVLAASEAHAHLASRLAGGDAVVAAAVHEPTGDPFSPSLSAVNGRLAGVKTCVLHGGLAEGFVVTTDDGLWFVATDADGVTVETQRTAADAPDALVTLDNAAAEHLGDVAARDAMLWRGASAACVMTAAACEQAVALVAEYTTQREQFGKPIASFQAVSQRAANSYIDTEAVRLTAWQAAWCLANDLPFEQQLLTAKFWAAEGGWRAVHGAMHVHGGVSVDRDYPLHRHFLLQKQCELHLGSATPTLARLGATIAAD